jgi:thiamine biosynthesis lipoprotein
LRRYLAQLFALVFLLTGCTGQTVRYERYRTEFFGLFDTLTIIIGYAESEEKFTEYTDVIHGRMSELHKLYDIYNEYEGINNLSTVNKNAGIAPVAVDRDIIDMLLFAREGYGLTDGAVNLAMGSVLRIWHEYRENGINFPETAKLPAMDILMEAVANTDLDDVIIDEKNGTVFLASPGMSLDVGATAKAYAAGQAIEAAKEAGLRSAIVSAGGNISTVGKPFQEDRDTWNVGVQDPELSVGGTQNTLDVAYFNDKTMAVSGGYQRYYTVDGQTYHHIIDPATLMPADIWKQVSVIHKNPAMADLLSTALFIMPYEQGKALAEKANADVLWIDKSDAWFYTDGYAKISRELRDL